jgi:hypothetical protein
VRRRRMSHVAGWGIFPPHHPVCRSILVCTAIAQVGDVRSLSILALLVAVGCSADRYFYRPAEEVSATIADVPAARYAIPPEAQRGDVRVASFGVSELDLEGREPMNALHVRLVVSNDSGATPWAVDTRSLHVEIEGDQPRPPSFVNASVAGLPSVLVPKGQARVIDAYFLVPPAFEDEDDIPRFDFLWSVQTDTRLVVERTPFERVEIEPVMGPPVYVSFGYEPYWWYTPVYSRPVVVRYVRPPRYYLYPRR